MTVDNSGKLVVSEINFELIRYGTVRKGRGSKEVLSIFVDLCYLIKI